LKNLVNYKISEMQKVAKELWNVDVNVNLFYDLNNTNVLGFYMHHNRELHLNGTILEQYGKKYIDEVVIHEFAHAIIKHRFPKGIFGKTPIRTHGKEFKEVCNVFGNRGVAFVNLFDCAQTRNRQNKTRSEIRRGL